MGRARLLVEVRGGAMSLRRAVVGAGETRTFGRTSLADFAVPHDDAMSRVHWQITWDGARAEVSDLGGGVLVGGEATVRAEAGPGAWIRAGGTDFMIFVEDVDAPDVPPPGRPLLEAARRHPGELFGLVDAAQGDAVLHALQRSIDDRVSLYDGVRRDALMDAAPYLVRFDPSSDLLRRLIARGFGRAWASYVRARVSLQDLRAHFRRLAVVTRQEDDRPMVFRYYDPRVLRAFLPIASARQREQLFGPATCFYLETRDGELLSCPREAEPGSRCA